MAIRVGIIHDNIETLNRFKATIEAYQPFLQVDFACSSMKEVERNEVTSIHYRTDILLLDMDMHNDSMAGFKVIDMYKQKRHKPKIIVVSEWCDPWMVKIMESKRDTGISGCITSDDLFDNGVLQDIIERVNGGNLFITDADKRPIPASAEEPTTPQLTEREKKIIRLLEKGKMITKIAQELGIKEGGVYSTLFQLRKRFNVLSNHLLLLATKTLI